MSNFNKVGTFMKTFGQERLNQNPHLVVIKSTN